MSNSFSCKNTNENKYDFHVGETPECIECENDNVLKCLVETSRSHDENPSITTITALRKQKKRDGGDRLTIENELRTNYATSFREFEVHNDDKNFVFLDEVGVAVVIRPSRDPNMRDESTHFFDFKLSINEINEICQEQRISTPIFVIDNARIHHYRGLDDDEEIAADRIKFLPPYSPFLNPIENLISI
ncbi:hypothetical protein CWI36_1836p0010 [Hamiltosporidium magnivora]|uniref:Tc1-like transposase DDE domain-containing protein n=1 Tax=Hamiltosporidium magnivora TaxID=148818 RepID=A0A4Q9KXX2_9MICR|nr:hypothetical protein CWI36_1836p0010 [Hamiltosporidium magnivora]